MSSLSLLINLTSLYPSSEIEDRSVWEDVVLHEVCRAFCICEDDRRRCRAGEEVQREVCLSAGVHNERVHWAAQTMWHHEGGRKPGLKGLWGSHTQRICPEVHLSLLIVQKCFLFWQRLWFMKSLRVYTGEMRALDMHAAEVCRVSPAC